MQEIEHWSISSEILCREAKKLWLTCDIIEKEVNIFYISSKSQKILFKSTDFWINSSLWFKLVQDKSYCYKILDLHWLPISESFYLSKTEYENFDTQFIKNLSFPLVIKPMSEAHWDWVRMNISSYYELLQKLSEAYEVYDNMIIQEQIEGDEVRVIVMQDEIIAAYIRRPPYVVWDWKKQIVELINDENANNKLRWDMYESPLTEIIIDDEVVDILSKQWYSQLDIPSMWKKVFLRKNSNIWTWGILEDVTHLLPEETKQIAIKSSNLFWLQFAWVDLILKNVNEPLSKSNWIILEINATPWIWWHIEVLWHNTAEKILKKLFWI